MQYSKGLFHPDGPAWIRDYFHRSIKTLANETRDWDGLSPR